MLRDITMRKTILLICVAFFAPGLARAMDCPTNLAQPLLSTRLAPIADELALADVPLGAPIGVLSQTADLTESVDQVLLRIKIDSCRNMAHLSPTGSPVNPDDPAAYKPRTAFDNTPWRFNMNQNGKKMTAEEFSAWMESKGVHVARGAGATTPPPPPPPSPTPNP
jgi:hypothetical protein